MLMVIGRKTIDNLAKNDGLATSPEDGADFDEVFKAADERMYLKKKEMKMGRDA